mmetsp:Transcript_4224/g.8524  ORF Transcript_4224/g.8524 Transcript_4224/m.8524 type:complete len:262 (+) Transcript_4224:604-1389(+)
MGVNSDSSIGISGALTIHSRWFDSAAAIVMPGRTRRAKNGLGHIPIFVTGFVLRLMIHIVSGIIPVGADRSPIIVFRSPGAFPKGCFFQSRLPKCGFVILTIIIVRTRSIGAGIVVVVRGVSISIVFFVAGDIVMIKELINSLRRCRLLQLLLLRPFLLRQLNLPLLLLRLARDGFFSPTIDQPIGPIDRVILGSNSSASTFVIVVDAVGILGLFSHLLSLLFVHDHLVLVEHLFSHVEVVDSGGHGGHGALGGFEGFNLF